MKTFRAALLGTALLAGAALPALAQPGPAAGPPAGPASGPASGPAPGAAAAPGGPMGRERGPRGPAVMFARVDANGDGRVVMDEVWTFVQARFAEADRNRDGALVLEEALAMPMIGGPAAGPGPNAAPGPGPHANPMHARMVAMMFRAVDANRDGKVTLDEVRPAVEMRFRGLDSNGDNGVTLDELPAPPRRGPPHGGPHGHGPGTPPPPR